jgi:hypothetical protein
VKVAVFLWGWVDGDSTDFVEVVVVRGFVDAFVVASPDVRAVVTRACVTGWGVTGTTRDGLSFVGCIIFAVSVWSSKMSPPVQLRIRVTMDWLVGL